MKRGNKYIKLLLKKKYFYLEVDKTITKAAI
jgi:hypothetical protein